MKISVRRFCIAPMQGYTDRHMRYLLRLISKHVMLYSEMISSSALKHGNHLQLLDFNEKEHPLALQLGGNDPRQMTMCATYAQQTGYDEVNINIGCPSDRVHCGGFGAYLMQYPKQVATLFAHMQAAVDIPVTIKCRLGVDRQNPQESLWKFVDTTAAAGCSVFIIHARKAWLSGLNPRQNRTIPPLDYPLVYQLKEDFPELQIIINGGFTNLKVARQQLERLDGVMMGREIIANPYMLSSIDQQFFNQPSTSVSRTRVLHKYQQYMLKEIAQGTSVQYLIRPLFGLFHQQPYARIWRRMLSAGGDVGIVEQAYHAMRRQYH